MDFAAAEQSASGGGGRDGLQKGLRARSQILRAKGTVIVLAESVGILWILQGRGQRLCLSQGQLWCGGTLLVPFAT